MATGSGRPLETIAIGFVQDAEAYRLAALRVHPRGSPHSDVSLLAPAWFLLCHSAELAMKAFLLSHGVALDRKAGGLKNPDLGHDLLGLYNEAVSRGLTPPDDDFGELMDWFGPLHKEHTFRYREKVGRLHLAAPWFVAEILEPVISDIEVTVRKRWKAAQSTERG